MNKEALASYTYEAEADAEALAPYQPDMLKEAGIEYRGGTDTGREAVKSAVEAMSAEEKRDYKARMLAEISDREMIIDELNRYI